MTTIPELPIQPDQIETLEENFSGAVFDNLAYLKRSIDTTDGVSNFIETELPDETSGATLNPYSVVRNGSGSQIIGNNDRPAFFDGGYHIRSFGNYTSTASLLNQFARINSNTVSVNNSYISYINAENGGGIQLPTCNAGLAIDMTMILERTSSSIPQIFFRPTRPTNRFLNISDNTGYMLAQVDTSFMDDNQFPRHITRATRTGNVFALRVQLTLRNRGNTFLLLEEGDASGDNSINFLPIQGTYRANFRPLENGGADETSSPNDYTMTPSITNCRIHYLDCLVGRQENRRTI